MTRLMAGMMSLVWLVVAGVFLVIGRTVSGELMLLAAGVFTITTQVGISVRDH